MVWLPEGLRFDLAHAPPGLAGDMALRMFCTPTYSERRQPHHRQLAERARFHLRCARWARFSTPAGEVQAYVFEPDMPAVGTSLIVHGWTSEASFMTALAEAVRRTGYRVVLFDLPGHGLSQHRSTNLMDCARATACVANVFAPIDHVIAHSFGTMTALVATEGPPRMPCTLNAARIVLIAGPNRLSEVTRHSGDHYGLDTAGQRALDARLQRIGQRPMPDFTTVNLLRAANRPALVVHSRDDAEVPFRCAEEIVSAVGTAELLPFDGLGHGAILLAPHVMRAITTWLAANHSLANTMAT